MLYFGDRSLRNVCASRAGFRGIYRDVCAGCASTTAFTGTFAQAAQVPRHLPRRLRKPRWVPRHLPRRLRKPRKFRGIYRDVCAGRASTTAFTETFAQAAQVPRHLPRRLRKPRKSRGICFAFAGVPASLTAFALAFAGVPASLAAFALAFAGVPASLTAFALAFAGVPQTFSGSRKRSQQCCNACSLSHCVPPPQKKNSSR